MPRARKPSSGRDRLHARVRTARGRKISSSLWLERQLNDPFVAAAKSRGYRARAAFKLTELDDRFRLFRRGGRVLDLGAAPGSWSQVAAERVAAGAPDGGRVVAVDIAEIAPIAGVECVRLDVLDPESSRRLRALLGGAADVVLSDMAAPATGHRQTDHLRVVALAEAAYAVAEAVLAPGGAFVAKVFQGGAERALLETLKRAFRVVRHAKPKASRQESSEVYVVALGFHGHDR